MKNKFTLCYGDQGKKDLDDRKLTGKVDISMKFRSSHQRCSVAKGVLRNFAKFTVKHL